MKTSNIGFIMKGITLAVSGILIAFFPNIITWIFYIIGGIIIIGSIATLFSSMSKGSGALMFTGCVIGIIIGAFVIYLPRIIIIQIPVIAGIIFGIIGVLQLFKGFGSGGQNKRTLNIVFGIVILLISAFCLFNPFKVGNLIRIIIGIVMILTSLYYFYATYVINRNNKHNDGSGIIDIY